jgi:hypothetical protein
MDSRKSVITLTFGDQAENHVGMEQIGHMVEQGMGFQLSDLNFAQKKFSVFEHPVELFNLHDMAGVEGLPPAYLLVVRKGVDTMLGDGMSEMLFKEQAGLDVDKKAFMYGRVVNKSARWNLCFDEKSKDPDYESGKGRIISFDEVSLTKQIWEKFHFYFGEKARDLKGEGNYYYDIKKCGIGFHGDSERRKVIAVRLGGTLDIHYQWYKEGAPVGNRIAIPLHGGDIYVMSEKAVGTDWKKKKIYTLRHATGCDKFTK